MTNRDTSQSRFEEVSRRAFLKRSTTLGAALLVPSWLLAACSGSEDVFASTTTASLAATSTTAGDSTTTAQETTSSLSSDSATIPLSAEMLINFSYSTISTQGPVKNPYVAVWIEDSQAELAATVALWFLQSQKGLKWLSDLRRWYSVDGTQQSVDTISSATRTPGDYSVVWDGTGPSGLPVIAGDYFVCIEAAREHGPYSLIREQLTVGSEGFDLALADDGELANASVTYAV